MPWPEASARCGPTCLRMVAKYYGRSYGAQELRELAQIGRDGVNLLGISEAAEAIGFRTLAIKTTYDKLLTDAPLPAIVHWSHNHFVVIQSSSPRGVSSWRGLLVADPAAGLLTYTRAEFEKQWATTRNGTEQVGIALLLEPTPKFYNPDSAGDSTDKKTKNTPLLGWGLFVQHRRLVVQLAVGLLVASLLQLIFPFLTQSVVDVGVQTAAADRAQSIVCAGDIAGAVGFDAGAYLGRVHSVVVVDAPQRPNQFIFVVRFPD